MFGSDRYGWIALGMLGALGMVFTNRGPGTSLAQEPAPSPSLRSVSDSAPPVPYAPPALAPGDRPLPINLPTALQLAGVRPLDIAVASQRLQVAAAQL